MTDDLQRAKELVHKEKMRLAAESLQRYLKITEDHITLDAIVSGMKQAMKGGPDGLESLDGILAGQAYMLDAAFLFYLNNAQTADSAEMEKLAAALKAQRQSELAMRTLGRMRDKVQDRDFRFAREHTKERYRRERTGYSAYQTDSPDYTAEELQEMTRIKIRRIPADGETQLD